LRPDANYFKPGGWRFLVLDKTGTDKLSGWVKNKFPELTLTPAFLIIIRLSAFAALKKINAPE
jgi:hypothetical protein